MRISYLQLMNAMARLEIPEPERSGQTYRIQIQDRVDILAIQRGHKRGSAPIKLITLELEAVPYGDGAQRWLEWEIILESK